MVAILLLLPPFLLLLLPEVSCHGRLIEPPSRASMWRYGFSTPPDYQDNQGFCGGWAVQWELNDGQCGLCGDPWHLKVREHEAPGGKYATGTIVRRYYVGKTVNITVDLTANHKGHFGFKLCPAPSAQQDPSQDCLDLQPLFTSSGSTVWPLPSSTARGPLSLQVSLPQDLRCDHCVLQWTYTTGNGWGVCDNGTSAMGCGSQETFRACADISIQDAGQDVDTTTDTTKPIDFGTTTSAMDNGITDIGNGGSVGTTGTPGTTAVRLSCAGAGEYEGQPRMDLWCQDNCLSPTHPYCPATHCHCY